MEAIRKDHRTAPVSVAEHVMLDYIEKLTKDAVQLGPEDLARLTDADWVERGTKQLARVIAVRGPAESAWVSRWPSALPVFDSAHRERVEALEAALSGQNLYLAGAAFHGSGIDAAVRSAEHTARALGGAP